MRPPHAPWFPLLLTGALAVPAPAQGDDTPARVRIGTLRVALHRAQTGELEGGRSAQAQAIAEVVQRVRPDVLVLHTLDDDAEGRALAALRARYLAVAHGDVAAIDYPHAFVSSFDAGEPRTRGGRHRGMAVLSRYPIRTADVRTFRPQRRHDVPDAGEPTSARPAPAMHVDVPIEVGGRTLHLLITLPTSDGPRGDDRRPDAGALGFWVDYVEPRPAGTMRDDQGRTGGLAEGAAFVIAAELDADAEAPDARTALAPLLAHPRIDARGARTRRGMRADPDLFAGRLIPSRNLVHAGSGVFPKDPDDPLRARLRGDARAPGWAHRLAWLDVQLPGAGARLVGEPFGAFGSMRFLDGFSFADHELTLLRWWTSGCPFCADSLPALDELRARHAGAGLAVVGVFHPKPVRAISDEQIRRAAAAVGFHGFLAVDPSWEKLRELWQRGAPQVATSISVLVDRDGRIVWVHPGPRLHDGEDGGHEDAARAFRTLEELVRARTR